MKLRQLFAVLACTVSSITFAADEVLDEVVVTATRVQQPLGQSLASTTVITQADIQASQAPDVVTILHGVAGVETSQNGGTGKAASLFLRGSNSTQVLVLIDGMRVNSATLGTTSIQDLMLDQVERIEVVRGNVSSVYGSEAIGGVVQIFTKKGRGAPSINASAGAGSLGTQRFAAGYGGAVDNTDFQVQVSSNKTNGVSAINPVLNPNANPDADGYRNKSVSANVRHAFNADHSVSGSIFNSLGENQYDSGFGLPSDANTNTQRINKISLASDNHFADGWQSHLQYAQGVDEYHDYVNGLPYSFGSLFQTTNRQLTWQNTLQIGSAGQLLLGAETLKQNVKSDTVYAVTQRTVNSLFAGYTGNYGLHQVQLNMRQDNNSQYGAEKTGLLGYGYAFGEAWRATASYSNAFRAPSFNELYYPGFGNPAISPERSHNLEAGLHYTAGAHRVDAVYFDNHITNLINTVLVDPVNFIFQAQNVGQARINGAEFSYAGRFDNTGVKAALTSQNPRDVGTGAQLDRRAKLHSSLGVTQQLGPWQVGGEWLYSDTRPDNSGAQTMAAYNVLNLTAGYAMNKNVKWSLRLDNLTSQDDSNAYGYNPLGRRLFVGINYQQ